MSTLKKIKNSLQEGSFSHKVKHKCLKLVIKNGKDVYKRQIFCGLMEKEINDFGVASMFWEEFYAKHSCELTFYKEEYLADDILEFDNIEDLRRFDSEFLLNIDSEIVTNICETLQ